jgi:hypothetical protein
MSAPLLLGTLPIRPFHPERFFGTIEHDGQTIKVAAIAARSDTTTVLLSLVGRDTSVSAALAKFNLKDRLLFRPSDGIDWRGPRLIERIPAITYRQYPSAIANTREKHVVALPSAANIAEGLLHPPDIPADPKPGESRPTVSPPPPSSRFVLGNWDEETPNRDSFLGHLRALRVVFLRRANGDDDAALAATWAAQLWAQGLARKLIVPVHALGVRAWELNGDLRKWTPLISEGVRMGWLPWRTEADDALKPFKDYASTLSA